MTRMIVLSIVTAMAAFSSMTHAGNIGGLSPQALEEAVAVANNSSVAIASQQGTSTTGSHVAVLQWGLASVVVGSSGRLHVGYRLEVLAVVPADLPPDVLNRMHDVARANVPKLVEAWNNQLKAIPGIESTAAITPKENELATNHFNSFATDVNKRSKDLYISISRQFTSEFDTLFPNYKGQSYFAIGLRPCTEPACTLTHENQDPGRFGKIYGWMKSAGLAKSNQAYVLNSSGGLETITAGLHSDYLWQQELPKAALNSAFINAANQARTQSKSISYSAAEMAQLPSETVAHVADVFDSAIAAASSVKSDPSAVLMGISDELGRARIKECVALRGKFELRPAGQCAGYTLTPNVITKCLRNEECAPAFGSEVNLDSLLLTPRTKLQDFAQQAPLPRALHLGNFEEIGSAYEKCKLESENAGYCVAQNKVDRQ